ncbi:hypothetical protein OUZ56_000567 [Daphnia magna]|uniref:Secreted protein n=1 Tax=Daphnia magna TaxID=35525 RepID=A0ABR0A030_9CRUS|nr:hypothetical protein OUZ56_000567 [Daphnia magna]
MKTVGTTSNHAVTMIVMAFFWISLSHVRAEKKEMSSLFVFQQQKSGKLQLRKWIKKKCFSFRFVLLFYEMAEGLRPETASIITIIFKYHR